MTKYIIIYKAFDGLEQVDGTEEYGAPVQAQTKIMELEKQYGKSMKFQICKIYKENDDIFIITDVEVYGINYINQKGHARILSQQNMNLNNLLAEYPTWQEAVNSKEFKGW